MGYALTKEHRRKVCVHEAAHAVIMALTGGNTWRIQVAPEGATTFEAEGGEGGLYDDVWGLHSGSDGLMLLPQWWRWDDESCRWIGDRRAFEEFWRAASNETVDMLDVQRTGLRRHMCIVLAGPLADSIQAGDADPVTEVFNACWESPGEDCALAWGFTELLPWRNEFDSMAEQTEAALRTPRIWRHVEALADEVERVGDLEDWEVFKRLLPAAVPGWPASPRGRAVTV